MTVLKKRADRSLRDRIEALVCQDRLEEIDRLVADDVRAVRHLVGMTHRADAAVRKTAARGIGLAARHHPDAIARVIRRLIWSMNEESGANGLTAPQVLEAIARERPELLVPVVPDMVRLSGDDNLHDGLADALCVVVHKLPGKVGAVMSQRLQERIDRGECCNDARDR